MKLSIITINLNNVDGLKKTIHSIINQSFSEYEWIVIDGGSTDGSKELIEEYSEKISFWVSENDTGIYNAMNKGVAHANGDFILFLNSGDYLCDNNVLLDVSYELNSSEIVFGNYYAIKGQNIEDNQFEDKLSFYKVLKYSIGHGSSFIPRNLLVQYPYNESLKIVSDWVFFVKALINSYPFRHINRYIFYFDCSGISSSNLQLVRQEKEKVIKSLLPPSILYDYQFAEKDDEIIGMIKRHRIFKHVIEASIVYMRLYERITMAIKRLLKNKLT